MMMTNGGNSYEWQFDPDDDGDFVADDGAMSMDIESFLSILDENPPDDSSQSGLADPSLSITPYNESVTHVGANEHSQILDDHSEASASGSKTVCSSGSSDYERQTVNYGMTKVGLLPDVALSQFYSLTPSDWSVPVPPGGSTSGLATNIASSSYDSREDFSSSSYYNSREPNFESATRGETFGISDQMMDKSGGITDGVPNIDVNEYSDVLYKSDDKSSIMPYVMNRNEPSYSVPVYNSGMLYNNKIASGQHVEPYASTKGSLLSSESSTDTPANGSTNGSRFPSMLPNRRHIVSVMEGETACDLADRLFSESFSGVHSSLSKKDHFLKTEHDTKRSPHFTNISNNPFTPPQSFVHHDVKLKKQQVSYNEDNKSATFTNGGAFGQQSVGKKITYIDVDDPDICILEDLSEPAPRKYSSVDWKSPINVAAHHKSPSVGTPPVHMGFNNSKVKPNDERIVYRVALQDLSQPKSEADAPDGALAVSLLRHQRIALSWMVQKETKSIHCFGGILADDQGLGKTISTIALILKERSPSSSDPTTEVKKIETETYNLDDDDDDEQKPNSCVIESNGSLVEVKNHSSSVHTNSRPAAGTLVVCPTSVLRQWNDELHNKVSNKGRLSVLIYHGANRTKDPSELAKYDVVLTTYAIVSMEVPKQPLVDADEDETKRFHPVGISPGKKRKYPPSSGKGSKKGKKGIDNELFESLARPLAKVRWFRVVLDEAQTIKNHRTQTARACWGLKAKRRWCLSGTPIQNAIDDLYSYFRFLRYDPYAVYRSFCSTIKIPIQRSPATGYKKLQAVLKTIMLRRTKATLLDGEPIITLPPKTINLKKVDFTPEERDFYCRLESDSRAQFAEYAAAGTVKQNYVNILLMLLRLRQACDHPLLVRGCNSNSEWKSSVEKAKKLPAEKRTRLLNCLEASLAICSICSDPPEDAVVTTCEHVFCNQCILEHLSSDESQCPSPKCKVILTTSSVFSKSTLKISLSDEPVQSKALVCSGSVTVKPEILEPGSVRVKPEIPEPGLVTVKSEILEPGPSNAPVNFTKIEAAEALDSSKIKAAVEVLESVVKPRQVGTEVVREKAIVFSQWTRMLDLLEACLEDSKVKYRRLDGTMSILARDNAVKDFNTLPEVSVMIMSLKAASLGLNMVAACHVLLLDLWWNPTTEDQAIDRAHRIGQTRPVSVLRLTVKDTVEDRILALQQKKREMVASAFGEDETGTSQTRLTVDDLKYLFQF